ncbi:MAG: PAS domain S-box protein [Elusimicrobiales bacterium]|nr:PAS domain S-box protein [Elusimicrobiales bacterium]
MLESKVSKFLKTLLDQKINNFISLFQKIIDFLEKEAFLDSYFILKIEKNNFNKVISKNIKKDFAYKILNQVNKLKNKDLIILKKKNKIFICFKFETHYKDNFFCIFSFAKSTNISLIENISNFIKNILPILSTTIFFNSLKNSSIVSYALHKMIYDKNGKPFDYEFVDINKSFQLMTGLKRKNIIGKTVRELIKGIEKEKFIETYGYTLKKQKELVFESFSAKLNRHYLINFKPIDKEFFITLFYDITEFKKSQQRELDFYKWYQNTFELSKAIKLIIDPENGKIVDSNKAATKFYGYTKKELLKMKISDINILGKDAFKDIKKVLNGYTSSFDFIHRLKNGEIRNVRVYPSIIEKEGKKYIYSIIFDVTDETESKKKIEMLISIMDNSLDEFYMLDSESFKFLHVNQTAAKNLGYTKDELLSMTPSDIAPEYNTKKLKELFKQFKEDKINSKSIITFHKRKDSSIYPVKVNLTKNFFENKLYFFAVVEDITEELKKKNELELMTRLYSTLSQANQIIVKSKDEKSLLNGITRVLVEKGKFSISFILKNNNGKPEIFSFYGCREKDIKTFIKEIFIKKDKKLATFKSFQLGITTIDNKYFKKTKEIKIFKRFNVKSVFSAPIKLNSKKQYTITIYSDKENFFTKEVVNLLKELCGDIKYALSKLEFEERLSESEKKYKAIFENSSAAMCIDEVIYDNKNNPIDYVILDINKAFEKITGFKKKDIIGKTSAEVYKTKNPLINKFFDIVKNKTTFSHELYFSPFSKYINISASSFGDRFFSTVFTDVTERYNYSYSLEKITKIISSIKDISKESIKKLFELFKDILNTAFSGIISYDDGKLEYIFKDGNINEDFYQNKILNFLNKDKSDFFIDDKNNYLIIISQINATQKTYIILFWKEKPKNINQTITLTKIIITLIKNENERLENKNNLLITNQKYQKLVNNQIDPVCLWKPNTEIVISNSSYNNIHGSDIVGKKWIDFVPDDYKSYVREKIEKVIKYKKPLKYEHPTLTNNNQLKWFEWIDNPILDENNNVIFIQSTGRDITDKKNYEDELLKLKTVVEQAPIEIIITDKEGNIEYVNPYFEEVTGYSKDEVIGKNPKILKSGKHDQNYYEKMWNTIKSGKTFKDIIINKRKDNSLLTEYIIISPLKNNKGEITHFVGIKRDITKEIEEEKAKEHSQRMELIGTLAGSIAHDFNNILVSIMGNAEILLRELKKEDKKTEYILDILNSSQKASSLIKNLLHFSKKQPLDIQVINITNLINSSKNMLSRLLGEKWELRFFCPDYELLIKGDINSLTQVLINLVINAKDAMPNGGTIEIGCFKEYLNNDNFFENFKIKRGSYAVFYVRDYGVGIDESIKDKIFNPFFTTKEFGTGLGLSTVYSIIKRHMGYITFKSEKGKGTEFRVYLPIFENFNNNSNETIINKKDKTTEIKKINIIFVDDDEGVRKIAEKIFKILNLDVIIFDDPSAAIEYIEKNNITVDLLITDIIMKTMNGKKFVDYLIQKGLLKKYIFISGYSDDIIDNEGINKVSENIIYKPFKINEIKKKIDELLKDIK